MTEAEKRIREALSVASIEPRDERFEVDTDDLTALLADRDEREAALRAEVEALKADLSTYMQAANEHLADAEALRADLEREHMRLAACGVVALANTTESAAKARQMHDDYRSASCDDVARAVDREMALRAALIAAKEIVQRERVLVAEKVKNGASPNILHWIDAVIAQADAALGEQHD